MPRERTTWNRDDIAKRASHSKSADPYLMNQDHVKGQPSADKYVIGDPSDFAEDPHPSTGTWKAEYGGGQVKRNEIGLPEMRGDTFNHPEKTAGEAGMIAKAALAVSVSRAMLPKTASDLAVEAQATSLMHMPDVELAATYKRLVAEQEQEDDDEDEGQEKQAQQDQGQQDQDQGQKQGGELPPALKKFNEEKKEKAEGKDDKDQGEKKEAQDQQQDQGQEKQAQQQQVAQLQAQLASMQQQVASLLQQAQQQVAPQVVQAQQDQGQQDQDQGQKQAQQDQGQQDQGQDKQAHAARIQKAMADAIAAGQDPVKAASEAIQACGPMGQGQTDAQLIDQMLAQQDPVVSDMGIEMDAPAMDMGEMAFTADDSVLKQLFASDDEDQGQQDQGQQKQASHAVRTASTRTVGTRPTAGVSQLGGLPSAGKKDDVSSLSSMWNQSPDVSAVFGTNGR